mgnify:CR=1 FL=1
MTIVKIFNKYVLPIINTVLKVVGKILNFLAEVALEILSFVGDIFTLIGGIVKGEAKVTDLGESFKSMARNVANSIKKLEPMFKSLSKIIIDLIEIVMLLPDLLNRISISITGKGIIENISDLFEKISNTISNFRQNLEKASFGDNIGILSPLETLIEGIISLLKGLITVIGPLISTIGVILMAIGDGLQSLGNAMNNFLGNLKGVAGVVWDLTMVTVIIVSIVAMVKYIFWLIDTIKSWIAPLKYVSDSLADMFDGLYRKFKADAIATMINSMTNGILKIAISLMILPSSLK